MTTIIITAAVIALVFAMVITLIGLVFAGAWHFVYYLIGCRRAPIQKAFITGAIVLWIICGAILSLLP